MEKTSSICVPRLAFSQNFYFFNLGFRILIQYIPVFFSAAILQFYYLEGFSELKKNTKLQKRINEFRKIELFFGSDLKVSSIIASFIHTSDALA